MPETIFDLCQIEFDRPGKHHYELAFHLDGNWGYSMVPLTVINGLLGSNSTGVAAFGGTHGNEWEGQIAVKRLCQDLRAEQMSGRVILIPQLCPSACIANTRESPLDGVNMNRAFPGSGRGTISYRIADFVASRVFPQVRVVIDIHSGGNEARFPYLTSFHEVENREQGREMAEVARLFDTPFVMIYSKDMASGLLTDHAEAAGKITIGTELGWAESVDHRGTEYAYEGTKNVLRHYGLLSDALVRIAPERSTPPCFVQALNLDSYTPCPRDGIWEPLLDVGVSLEDGQLIGRLHDFSDHTSPPLEIRSPRKGILLMSHFSAQCQKGTTLFVVAERASL